MSEGRQPTLHVRSLESPDDRRVMEHGVIDVASLPGATIARATFQPGWRWSTDAALSAGTASCQVAHAGYVVSGRFHVRMDDGDELDLAPGDAHVVGPGHDAWVVGDQPCVIIDIASTEPPGGKVGRCPCGIEFRVPTDSQLDHLVAAIREHARASHGHELTSAEVLAEVSGT